MTVRFGTFFSGIGGIDLGFEQAGMECAFQVEIDKYCQKVLEKNFPNTPKWLDITTVSGSELPQVDVIAFGSPCQDLSIANSKGKGLDGKQSSLFYEGIRLVAELSPATILWENVPGALSSNSGRDFARVLASFRDIGTCDIGWRVLDAQYFGVPQRRRRLFLIASFRTQCASEILFEKEQGHFDPDRANAPINEISSFKRRGGFGWSEGRGIVGTLETTSDRIPIVFDNGLPRRLTPVECERCQGFPDNFTYLGKTNEQRYKQIGNSVAPPVAKWLGERIVRYGFNQECLS